MRSRYPLRPVADTGEVLGGRQRSPHLTEGKAVPYLRVANVFDGFIDFDDLKEMAFRETEIAQYRLRNGDVLLNEGQSLDLVGRTAMFTCGPIDCCYQNTLIRYRAGPDVFPEYAAQLFRFCQQSGIFSVIATRTNSIAHLGVSRFAALELPFPVLPIQRRIAEILGAWDEAIEKTERLIAAREVVREQLRRSYVSWDRWPLRPIGEVVSAVSRPHPTPITAYTALGIRSHGKGTFQRRIERPEEIDMDTVYVVSERDLIVNITFAWEGAIALAKPKDAGCFVSHRFPTFEIDEKLVSRSYLGYAVGSPRFTRELGTASPGGAGRNRVLNKSDFLKIGIPFPPRTQQVRIADVLDTAGQAIALLSSQRRSRKAETRPDSEAADGRVASECLRVAGGRRVSTFRDGEIHNSQVSALHLLQVMKPGWTLLTKIEVDRERRGRLGNVLLEDILATQLAALNRIEQNGRFHPFSEANISTAIEQLRSPEPLGLMTLNEKTTDLLQLGTSLDQTIEGVTRGRSLRYIDWDTPANNAFHVVAELDVEKAGSHETRRPDIVLLVNGIPLAVIECKAPHVELSEGVGQIITYQRADEIPHLFRSVQLVLAVKPAQAKYATVGTAAKFWAVWREKEFDDAAVGRFVNAPLDAAQTRRTFGDGFAEEQVPFEARRNEGRTVTEQDRLIHALCRPDRLLDLARRFTLFDLGIKKIARYQQFFAVRKILDRVKAEHDAHGARRGGVVWHTQGSGKSLTMVMLAKALGLDSAITNRRVVLVTDRIDLDDQLRDTFKACGADVAQAKTGAHLLDLIARDKAAIISTVINKFEAAIAKRDFRDESTEVFLLVDESHRGQYGEMHTRMKRVFPRACYIGFTGTPLTKAEKSTAARFGGIIDTYSIDQAVKDKAVLPLIYEGKQVAQEVNRTGIDTWFDRVTRELSDQQRADLKRKLGRYSEIAQGDQTITAIAYDIAEHFIKFWKGTRWKAQFAVRSRAAAVKYYEIFKEMGTISAEVIMSAPDDRSTGDDPAEEVTEPVIRFWKTMMAKYGGEDEYNRQITEGFKKREDPELLIVVSKLLTGFDAPVDTVLYIDKSLTGHNLLQAIARVNRVEENKEYGYIVDYAGVLGELDTAMRTYSALAEFEPNDLDVGHAIIDVQAQIARLPQAHANLLNHFKGVGKVRDEEAYEVFLADEARRKEFYRLLAEFARLLATTLATSNWANDPKNEPQLRVYKNDLRRYQKLRTAVRSRYREAIDFEQYEARIRKLLNTHISADAVEVVTEPVNIFDTAAFDQAVAEQSTPASKADLIASQTKRTITERMEEDPVFFKKISDLIAEAIAEHRAKRLSDNEYLARIREAAEQVRRPKHDDVPADVRADEHAVAVFNSLDNAMASIVGPQGGNIRPVLAAAALELVSIVKALKVVNWTENVDVQNAMRNRMDDYFFEVIRDQHRIELTPDQIDAIVDSVLKVARARMA